MVKVLMSLMFVLSSTAAYEWRNISANYGDTTMLLNVAIGDGIIELQSHKPDNAPDTFHETTNLHVFSKQLVAMRDSVDKACYVRHINETFEVLKEKINGIEQHDANKGQIAEDWVDVDNVCPIESWAVKELLGDEIDCFCRFHNVYYVGLVHTGIVDLKGPGDTGVLRIIEYQLQARAVATALTILMTFLNYPDIPVRNCQIGRSFAAQQLFMNTKSSHCSLSAKLK